MKKIIYSLLLLIAVSTAGCQQWLDVQPKTTIKQDKLFETESGFRDALVGCYMLMSESGLYGRELTITFLEVLAQQYEMQIGNSYYSVMRYEYENMDSRFTTIWSNMYTIIANLNSILNNIDNRRDVLSPTAYALIKGEALGLRAALHFDLLRMFGPGNLAAVPANKQRPAIPYVTRYDKDLTPQHTVAEVMQFVHQDLAEAVRLLNLYDTYGKGPRPDDYNWPSNTSDLFYQNRTSRMNYHAVKAVQSRAFMWEGKYQEALDILKTLVGDGAPLSWINADASINGPLTDRNYKATTEGFFVLNPANHFESVRPYVEYYTESGEFTTTTNQNYFFHTMERAAEVYEVSTVGRGDWRYSSLYNKDKAEWTFLKYTDSSQWRDVVRNRVVLIKKPEVYYMAAECYNRLGDREKAASLINDVRISRGIEYDDNLDGAALSSEQMDHEIEKEYAKEFIGEGVMFYYYKRLNKAIPYSNKAAEDNIFIFPLPKREIETGGRVNP